MEPRASPTGQILIVWREEVVFIQAHEDREELVSLFYAR